MKSHGKVAHGGLRSGGGPLPPPGNDLFAGKVEVTAQGGGTRLLSKNQASQQTQKFVPSPNAENYIAEGRLIRMEVGMAQSIGRGA